MFEVKELQAWKMASLYQIEKLDGTNYDSWCIHMRSILVHSGWWKHASGVTKRESSKTDPEMTLWDTEDEKALATITLCVKPTQLNLIKNCKTSNEAWIRLEEAYKPRGPLQKVSLYKRLMNLTMPEGGNVNQHINNFTELSEKLAETGIVIQDELLVIMLLSSLPVEYENFVVAIETRDALPTLTAIKQKVLEEGDRHKQKNDRDETNVQQVLSMKTSIQNKDKKVNKYKHNKIKGKCFNCGEFGHYSNKCPKSTKKHHLLHVSQPKKKQNLKYRQWCLDSGATSHMCCERDMFSNFVDHVEEIHFEADKYIVAKGKGDVEVDINGEQIKFKNVLYSPELNMNFISVGRVVRNGLTVVFDAKSAVIKNAKGKVIIRALKQDNLFIFESKVERLFATTDINQLWHNRLGHLNYNSLCDMSKKDMVIGMNLKGGNRSALCKTCMLSKIRVNTFPQESTTRTNGTLEVIHSDVCGPFRVNSPSGSRYFVTFIDDFSRRIFVYFLKAKSEVLRTFKTFKQHVEKQTGRKIKVLRSDNGREYVNKEFDNFLESEGISRQLTVPHTPQQNGIAERANRTLVEMARSMMIHSGVQQSLWAEAVNTAAYLRNRCPTKILENKTPYEVWFNRKPNIQHLRTFGSYAVALNKNKSGGKFEAKGEKYIMVGYSQVAKAYRLYNKSNRSVVERRDVLFDENNFENSIDEQAEPKAEDYLTIIVGNNQQEGLNNHVSKRRSTSIETSEDKSDDNSEDFLGFESASEYGEEIEADKQKESTKTSSGRPKIIKTGKRGRPRKEKLSSMINENIPNTVEEAMSGVNRKNWYNAMKAEMTSLINNKTWSLADLPPGANVIDSKWVYALKRDENGNIDRFKARLVAKGCSQRLGIDYSETFSPVARYSTIRLVMSLAVQWKMHLHQIDVSSAYLNSDIQHEIYIRQPPEFVDKKNPNKVLKLHKAIYGLKQSGKEWNAKLDHILKHIGFEPCANEPCLYKATFDNELVLVTVYVDDLMIASKSKDQVLTVKRLLAKEFPITDKGQLHHYLGFEVEREGETGAISICQSQYIRDLLKEYGMQDCKAVSTPLETNFQVKCDNIGCEEVPQKDYQSAIGALMYLAITTRPDIIHSVSKLAQRNVNPHSEHMQAVKRILRYLRGTINTRIVYRAGEKSIEGFVDADWGGSTLDRKSYSGFIFFVGDCPVSWQSVKQSCVALSSTEAEYMAMSEAAKEAIFLKRLLEEIGYTLGEAVILNVDNQGAEKLASNPVHHKRTKHIDIRFHHVREVVKNKDVHLKYCPTQEMIADILTKNLAKTKHNYFAKLMKLI